MMQAVLLAKIARLGAKRYALLLPPNHRGFRVRVFPRRPRSSLALLFSSSFVLSSPERRSASSLLSLSFAPPSRVFGGRLWCNVCRRSLSGSTKRHDVLWRSSQCQMTLGRLECEPTESVGSWKHKDEGTTDISIFLNKDLATKTTMISHRCLSTAVVVVLALLHTAVVDALNKHGDLSNPDRQNIQLIEEERVVGKMLLVVALLELQQKLWFAVRTMRGDGWSLFVSVFLVSCRKRSPLASPNNGLPDLTTFSRCSHAD